MKLTITQLGTPKQYQGAKGPFEKNWLKAKEMNDKFLNFFVNKTTANWQVGHEVEVEGVEERQYISKKDNSLQTSYDIKLPRFGGNGDVMKALEEIKNTLTKIKLDQAQGLKEIYEAVTEGKTKVSDYPEMKEAPNFDHTAESDIGPLDAEDMYNSI